MQPFPARLLRFHLWRARPRPVRTRSNVQRAPGELHHAGTPGASARQRARRLRQERESLTATRHASRLPTAAASSREHLLQREEERWTAQARAEEMLAELLARLCPAVPMLHDRRAPDQLTSIKHIALAPSGLYVIQTTLAEQGIDADKHRRPRLHDRIQLATSLERQAATVEALVGVHAPQARVHGCICAVRLGDSSADAPLQRLRTVTIDGYPLYSPNRLAKRLNRKGPLAFEAALTLQATLARRLSAEPSPSSTVEFRYGT